MTIAMLMANTVKAARQLGSGGSPEPPKSD
jgi:hypothetical protein